MAVAQVSWEYVDGRMREMRSKAYRDAPWRIPHPWVTLRTGAWVMVQLSMDLRRWQ